jgi:DNA-binding CsgD family transcriptional regulator
MTLTLREAQVLWHLAQGCTYERIGDRLGVSLHTVTTHIKSIYRKLEVHSAAAAVRRAIELDPDLLRSPRVAEQRVP